MRVMTSQQEQLLERLLRLADGDMEVLEKAFRKASSRPGSPPTLVEIVDFIMHEIGYKDFAEVADREIEEEKKEKDLVPAE